MLIICSLETNSLVGIEENHEVQYEETNASGFVAIIRSNRVSRLVVFYKILITRRIAGKEVECTGRLWLVEGSLHTMRVLRMRTEWQRL